MQFIVKTNFFSQAKLNCTSRFLPEIFPSLVAGQNVITEDFQTQSLTLSSISSPWTGFAILFPRCRENLRLWRSLLRSVPWAIWESTYPPALKRNTLLETQLWDSALSLLAGEGSETTAHGQQLPCHFCQISFTFTGPAQRLHLSQGSTTDAQDCPTLCTAGSWNQTTTATNDASRRVLLHLLFTPFPAIYLLYALSSRKHLIFRSKIPLHKEAAMKTLSKDDVLSSCRNFRVNKPDFNYSGTWSNTDS